MKYTTAILFLVILTACAPGTRLTIFNNTEEPLVVSFVDSKEDIELQPSQSGELYAHSFEELKIQSDDDIWLYRKSKREYFSRTADLPSEYVNKGWPVEIKLQINQNKKLYILPKRTALPFKEIDVQPKNFPIAPLTK